MQYLYPILSLYLLWVLFLAVMPLYRAYLDKALTPASKVLGYPLIIVMLTVDCLVNITIMTLVLLEFPREYLVTKRLTRLSTDGGWRGKLARGVCKKLLDAFDPRGKHCFEDSHG
jgi:hypothetical protein